MSAPALLTFLALATLAVRAPGDDERLDEAKSLLQSRREEDVRRGVRLCADVDTPEAAELLLGLIALDSPRGLQPAHYRDIAWEGLVALDDPYARARVAQELVKGRDARVRQWCAEALGVSDDAAFAAELRRALVKREIDVQRAAARSLGLVGEAGAVKELLAKARDRDPVLRANAIESVARIELEAHRGLLVDAIENDGDGGVRCALLGAARELLPEDEVERLSAAALADPDWRPRMQAVENLAGIRTKPAVDVLVDATEDGRPVVASAALRALSDLTGQKHSKPEAWRAWWKENRETFDLAAGGRPAASPGENRSRAVFNGIVIESDHAAFLIDSSKEMAASLASRPGATKAEAAAEELERALASLQGGRLDFDVLAYSEGVEAFGGGLAPLDERRASRAVQFVRRMRLRGAKDVWQVLEAVLDDPEIDTAYLLSSGEPDTGLYVHWNRVTWHLRDRNRFRKLVVHSVAYSANEWYRDQLQRIAEATGGEFQWFE